MDEPTAKLIEIHSKGIDSNWMSKRAAMFDDIKDQIKPEKGKTCIHLITTGAGETYGSNNNSDYFNKEAREVTFPHPKKGASSKRMLAGGLKEYHKTFMKTGAVYKHHKDNKDKNKSSGSIKFETYNPKMERGELIVELDNNKWESELNKLANDESIYFSIGAGVPYDICSICNNVSTTRDQYCHHMKNEMLQMDKNANQVFVYNDKPGFHDISGVFRPADKIAFGLRKVANGVVSSAELAEMSRYSIPVEFTDIYLTGKKYDRRQVLKKLAAMEEVIDGVSDDSPLGIAKYAFCGGSGFDEISPNVLSKLGADTDQSLSEMGRAKVVLPLELFFKLALGNKADEIEPHIKEAKSKMPSLFRDIESNDGLDEFLGDGTYDGAPCLLRNIKDEVGGLTESHSLADEPLRKRITVSMIRKEPGSGPSVETIKKASSEAVSGPANFLAREYGKYLLSFCRDKEEDVQKLAVVQKVV